MRIISNFKDYYDNVQGFGFDPKLVYVRENEKFFVKDKDPDPRQKLFNAVIGMHQSLPRPPSLEIEKGLIVFCSQVHGFYSFEEKCYFSFEKLREAVQLRRRSIYPETLNWLNNKRIYGPYKRWWGIPDLTERTWNEFNKNARITDDFFRSVNSPVVAVYPSGGQVEVSINPRLYEFNFASVIDPFTAHQTLAMYVGNNMANQMDPNPKISDDLKRDSHGMDEWSFKRHKTESKKFRKKNP